ncbi:ABC-F type ribosomal protection protein [Mesobacillus maritimus]|uniref:ribosomal protection-like ABC-F family protein n=1 Tax=Mesobacillus maritimus TaxID=1643336 RepID=UPI00204058F3|nr:ABC-F type ribosomal protection protein [Mesobacillus maritimus]MCM3584133.1 ABC-F type ribosomal protection protein [Mesobacillus maritimus]
MITCSVNKIAKMYGGNIVFENISFEIHEKDRVGLVGRNGSGKSTLFRLLAGAEQIDSGQIHWSKGLKIGYLEQIPSTSNNIITLDYLKSAFQELLLLAERIEKLEEQMGQVNQDNQMQNLIDEYGALQDQFIVNGGYEIDASIEKIVNGLKITELLYKPFSSLSGGEKTKVGLAHLLLQSPDLLLLDEPTNHLDIMAVEWLGTFLKEYKGPVVIISHDRYFLDEVVTKIIDLEDGEIDLYQANFTEFLKAKEEKVLKEFQAYEEQQKKMKKMKEAIKRLREWANRANPPNEGLHKRARNMERALERMEKLERPILNRRKMNLQLNSSERSGKDVIMLSGVSKSFKKKLLFEEVNIHIQHGERVAIVGENGSGKSTLIKLVLQEFHADNGHIRIGSNVKIGYLSQHTFPNHQNESVINIFRQEIKVTEGEARKILARFLFFGHMVFRKVSQLSGGERMRLRLAQLMHQDINLLIFDEPTNHLDIESREVLEDVLEDYNGTLLAVSHDRYFLNKLVGKIYWIRDKKVHAFVGNYHYAKKKLEEMKSMQEAINNKKVEKKRSMSFSRSDKKSKQGSIKKELERIEMEVAELEEKMKTVNRWEELQQLNSVKGDLEQKWEGLYEKLDNIS